MVWQNRKTDCSRIRQWLLETLNQRLEITSTWLQRHLADCPKCRRQIAGNSRLRLAMLLIKTQSHSPDLLMQANRRAIRVLQRNLQELPQAEKLRHIYARPLLRERLSKYTLSISHAAACLLVLVLLRMGIFSSLTRIQDQGQQFVKQYYAPYLDQDLHDDTL